MDKIIDSKDIEDLQNVIDQHQEITKMLRLKYRIVLLNDISELSFMLPQQEKINIWCQENCQGEWIGENLVFMFELEQDFVAFKLRWVGLYGS